MIDDVGCSRRHQCPRCDSAMWIINSLTQLLPSVIFCHILRPKTVTMHGTNSMARVSLLSYSEHNPLWPSDAIWPHKTGSKLAQVMTCSLMAPIHCLNQCWQIISEVLWHSLRAISQEKTKISILDMSLTISDSTLQPHLPEANKTSNQFTDANSNAWSLVAFSSRWTSCDWLKPCFMYLWHQTAYYHDSTRHTSQIPQCIRQISHKAPFSNRNVHISVTKWCIVGYGTDAL